MRILIEAHHPAHIHFWKYPVKRLLEMGHLPILIGRDRDVIKRLLEEYDWIPHYIPNRYGLNNRFPLVEMIHRQLIIGRKVLQFNPHVVTSLMGSYCQSAKLLGKRNVIFTDSEFQHFNHRISHPFADKIFTPACFYRDLGRKQVRYNGIHELMFLRSNLFRPDRRILDKYSSIEPGNYLVVRISSWNTLHDLGHSGFSGHLTDFIKEHSSRFRILVSAEENQLPEGLDCVAIQDSPQEFHDLLYFAAFVITEGASTASEASCLGVPTVYINSTEQRGYLQMLENRYGIVKRFETGDAGLSYASSRIRETGPVDWSARERLRKRIQDDHPDGVDFVVESLIQQRVSGNKAGEGLHE